MKPYLLLAVLATLCACNGSDDSDTAFVYIDKEAIQCESVGILPAESELTLTSNNIEVIRTQCAVLTGVEVLTVCGGPTTDILIHEIAAQDEIDALALGYVNVSHLKDGDASGFAINTCEEP